MSKLIRWETPFTDKLFPSVVLITTSYDSLSVIVADAVDKYPKYTVGFDKVIAFACMEEAGSPRSFLEIEKTENDLCAYIWADSPWSKSYVGVGDHDPDGTPGSLFHYLIFGGDNNVEVLTAEKPSISLIDEKTAISVNYEI
jgi:hypothetical protein